MRFYCNYDIVCKWVMKEWISCFLQVLVLEYECNIISLLKNIFYKGLCC